MTATSPPTADDRRYVRRVATTVGVTLLLLGLVALFGALFEVLLLVFMAVLIVLPLRAAAGWVHERTGLPQGLALVLVVLGILGVIAGSIALVGPSVSKQFAEARDQFPALLEQVNQRFDQTSWGKALIENLPSPQQLFQGRSSGMKQVFGAVSSTFGVLADVYVILFLAAFLTAQPDLYVGGIVALVPPSGRQRARHVLAKLGETMLNWLLGKLFAMAVVGVLTWLGLLLLGVPLAGGLALFAALMAFIPNFGPIIALIPGVLFALPEGGNQALYVVALYTGIQFVESNLLTPLIQKRMVNIPPALVILSQVVMGVFVGGLGLALADGIVVFLIILIKMLYLQDWLRDESVEV